MQEASIYQFVKDKLAKHGVKKTEGGLLTLSDQKLFTLFVKLERTVRDSSFDAVQSVALEIEKYLISIEKRHLMAFTYLYLKFSDFTPRRTERDEQLPDGTIRKSKVFRRQISDDEMLIGLWARVKYDQVGERLLRVVYADPSISSDGRIVRRLCGNSVDRGVGMSFQCLRAFWRGIIISAV